MAYSRQLATMAILKMSSEQCVLECEISGFLLCVVEVYVLCDFTQRRFIGGYRRSRQPAVPVIKGQAFQDE
jgi:hypothetical protein